jgi:hypothetical protein
VLPFAWDQPVRIVGFVDTGLIVCVEKKIDEQEQMTYEFHKISL